MLASATLHKQGGLEELTRGLDGARDAALVEGRDGALCLSWCSLYL